LSKILGDIRKSGCTTGINDTGGKFSAANFRLQICHWCQQRRWQIAICINDTGSKFATGVVYTGGKRMGTIIKVLTT
jgi:hypothetical protein